MIKYLFILINSISLFIYSLFSGDGGITVTNNIPKNLEPGKEVAIEIKVAKGNQSGFAKLQLELPTGLSVKEIDNKGANYSFTDGIAKWVWASLPAESDLIVKVTLVADAGASGLKSIIGKYSFVENNAKQVIEMIPAEITIGTGDVAAANTPTTTNTNTTAVTTSTVEPVVTPTVQPSGNSEPIGNITVQRTITKGNFDGDYVINLKVLKGLTKGFARYSDDLPKELSARATKTEGASFSVSDGKIKFVWVAVPEKEELELSYTISGAKSSVVLNGEYSYLEQNQSKKFLLPVETISAVAEQTVANTNTTSPTNTAVTEPTVAVTTPTVETPPTTNTVAPETKTTEPVVNNTPTVEPTPTVANTPDNTNTPTETLTKKEGNVNYMVQIGAFTNSAVQASTLSRKFNISERINSEMQGGFSKFMVGNHPEYKNARDHREKVKSNNGVGSAFVVAYNTGKRITVQEALMISNQKWFK